MGKSTYCVLKTDEDFNTGSRLPRTDVFNMLWRGYLTPGSRVYVEEYGVELTVAEYDRFKRRRQCLAGGGWKLCPQNAEGKIDKSASVIGECK